MTLIRSISGIRGTLGGKPGEGLSPLDVVKYTAAFCSFVIRHSGNSNPHFVIGMDARPSGPMIRNLVNSTLMAMGARVTDMGLTTTPTTEMAVTALKAQAGIILTASHNPVNWNALKLLNSRGEFISAAEGLEVLEIANHEDYTFAAVENLGTFSENHNMLEYHIRKILELPLVDIQAIRNAGFRLVVDGVNSSGGIAIPELLRHLGVNDIIELNCNPDGNFAHNPEPLPENLQDIASLVISHQADLGIVVDPDVDRLALVCENGEMFGEEYTLVAVADYVLRHQGGNTVSNLSSTRALRDITLQAGYSYHAAAVGEVNVVEQMKKTGAVIGGEGNGGVIYPDLHYGRDALVGVALFLSHLAQFGGAASELRKTYPSYVISKNKIDLKPGTPTGQILEKVALVYRDHPCNTIDGLKIEFSEGWVHLRQSNTEPIIRIYAEGRSEEQARQLAEMIMDKIRNVAG